MKLFEKSKILVLKKTYYFPNSHYFTLYPGDSSIISPNLSPIPIILPGGTTMKVPVVKLNAIKLDYMRLSISYNGFALYPNTSGHLKQQVSLAIGK